MILFFKEFHHSSYSHTDWCTVSYLCLSSEYAFIILAHLFSKFVRQLHFSSQALFKFKIFSKL